MNRGRILVVDDNELNRELLSEELSDEGFAVITAADGPEALAIVEREEVDLILLDIQMPQMSGLEVLETVRRTHPLGELPIIMATARTASADVVEALGLGATDYVTKPIDFPVLLARITTHMRTQERRSSPSTGAYRRLKGDGKPRFVEVNRYCPTCLTANDGTPDTCPECGAAAGDGWPLIPRHEYPELGRIHGGYYFDKMLGSGWEGVVYRVRSVDLDRAFAAKVAKLVNDSSLDAAAVRQLVVAEVEALARLRNPHVVQIFEVVHLRADVYALITEFLEGTTLRQLVDEGPLRPIDALAICRQVALGLDEVHHHGMVHCDLKPENVIVRQLASGEYFAKVLDFGIVKSSGTVTPGGVFIGTPKYAPPESFAADVQIDGRADVYSLGVLLYRLLTAQPPFRSEDFEQLLRDHVTAPIPRLEDSGATHPDFALFDAVIRKAMAKTPDLRYQSMPELIEALDDVRRRATSPEESPNVTQPASGDEDETLVE